jgi:hypothetical protein
MGAAVVGLQVGAFSQICWESSTEVTVAQVSSTDAAFHGRPMRRTLYYQRGISMISTEFLLLRMFRGCPAPFDPLTPVQKRKHARLVCTLFTVPHTETHARARIFRVPKEFKRHFGLQRFGCGGRSLHRCTTRRFPSITCTA